MHHCHDHNNLHFLSLGLIRGVNRQAAGQCYVTCDGIAQAIMCMHCLQMLSSTCGPCIAVSLNLFIRCLQAMIWRRVAGKWFLEMSSAHPKMLSYCVSRLAAVCRSSHQPLRHFSLLLLVSHSVHCSFPRQHAACLCYVHNTLQRSSSHHLHLIITPC